MKNILVLLLSASLALAQGPSSPDVPVSAYILGPDDQISLSVPALREDFNGKTFRINLHGDVTLPYVGIVRAGGQTVESLQDEIKAKLDPVLKDPDVVVSVSEFSSQPVSILGAVASPGIRQVQGHKSLFEVLSLAGGLRADASTTIKITRSMKYGPIPVPDAQPNETGEFTVATVTVKNIVNASAENITIKPGDTIFVPKAQLVYVVGAVFKPGGSPLAKTKGSPLCKSFPSLAATPKPPPPVKPKSSATSQATPIAPKSPSTSNS